MLIADSRQDVVTSHGTLAVEQRAEGETAVLLLHGNSSGRGVFRHQFEGSFAARYRMIAFDLPGHGQSSDALDPQRTYTLPGFADATLELLAALGISDAIVFGWSLGGHIAIEMISRYPGLRALRLSGSPPTGKLRGVNDMRKGFNTSPRASIAGEPVWSESDAHSFLHSLFGESADSFLLEAAMRADGRLRKRLLESSREGVGTNQREAVESATIPIAVVNGAEDPFVDLDYFETVNFQNLWDGVDHRLAGLGHAPFWARCRCFQPVV